MTLPAFTPKALSDFTRQLQSVLKETNHDLRTLSHSAALHDVAKALGHINHHQFLAKSRNGEAVSAETLEAQGSIAAQLAGMPETMLLEVELCDSPEVTLYPEISTLTLTRGLEIKELDPKHTGQGVISIELDESPEASQELAQRFDTTLDAFFLALEHGYRIRHGVAFYPNAEKYGIPFDSSQDYADYFLEELGLRSLPDATSAFDFGDDGLARAFLLIERIE